MSVESKNYLKTIRIFNFKSYKGLIEAGPLFSGLNSIVGPNGSGKSNLFDAFLFVIGKKASQIRFKRLYQLIFSSNEILDNFASVCTVFNRSIFNSGMRKIEFKEFTITRKIFSRFSSLYLINGREITYRSFKKLIGLLKFNLKNDRFLIQQGEVEKISSMKPMGIKNQEIGLIEFLEDSMGSTRYLNILQKKKIIFNNKNLKNYVKYKKEI